MVKDIYPGPVGGNPASHINNNGILYFSADDGVHGLELWRSDGTTNGTAIVKDINPGFSRGLTYSYSDGFTNVNGLLYFSANDGVNGWELWKSDGTANGTAMVKNIGPGSDWSYPTNLTNINGVL